MITQETKHPDIDKDIEKLFQKQFDKINVAEIANIFRDDIQSNFDKGLNADGSKMRSLSRETIALKKKAGGIAPMKPLIFKGGSQRGMQTQRVSKNEAIVVPTGNAKNYFSNKTISTVDMLGYQAKADREPFGISDKADKKVDKYLKNL